jgi:hypothetical protein
MLMAGYTCSCPFASVCFPYRGLQRLIVGIKQERKQQHKIVVAYATPNISMHFETLEGADP